ncbi:MAG: glycosyltransferase [Planctomycetes bacterium]|nr:glycosyltransferase [Planctomycetota bacterium]
MDLTVVIPTYDEGANIKGLIEAVRGVLARIGARYEVIVVDAGSADDTRERATEAGAQVMVQTAPGYGGALKDGFRAAQGDYVLTMDADLSHDPSFIEPMYAMRAEADVIIASRYVAGGQAEMSRFRYVLSVILNRTFCFFLALPVRDISSGFRLYRRAVVDGMDITSRNFDVLEEILIKAYVRGYRVVEIPFRYLPRVHGQSHAKLITFGISYTKTFLRMFWLRYASRKSATSNRQSASRSGQPT